MSSSDDQGRLSEEAFVECSLTRATSYVTTNGLILVTLCGLFATTIAVLIAIAEEASLPTKKVIYTIIVPAFSFVLLTVSFNIYSWICEQLSYLSVFGRYRPTRKRFMSYEEWLEEIDDIWLSKEVFDRYHRYAFEVVRFYLFIPFKMNNIYCYYFLLYISVPIITTSQLKVGWDLAYYLMGLIMLQLLAAFIGLRGMTRMVLTESEIQSKLKSEGVII